MKKFLLFDNDGVLVETEQWYYEANVKALAEIDVELTFDVYMEIMARGGNAWEVARAQNISKTVIDAQRLKRDIYYREFIQSKHIEIDGVVNTLEELRNKIITYYQKKANNYFHPIDIPKDTTLSVVERVSLFMKNNPSKFLNIEEIEEEVINQLEKLSTTHGNIFNKKLEITMTFKRVTQSRALLLRLIYNDYNDKVSINRDFKVGHEVQALGFEISDLEIKL